MISCNVIQKTKQAGQSAVHVESKISGRLLLLKLKDSLELRANLATTWAAELQTLLTQWKLHLKKEALKHKILLIVQLGTTSGWTENHSRFCSPLRKLLVSSFPELLTVQPKGGQRLQLGEENHLILILTSARHLLCRTWFLKYQISSRTKAMLREMSHWSSDGTGSLGGSRMSYYNCFCKC